MTLQPMSPSLEPADMKMSVTILHACPLALQQGNSYLPLVWREPGFEEMKNAMNSSLEAMETDMRRNMPFMPVAIDMKHACNKSFRAVLGQKSPPDVLVLSGQELELLDPLQLQHEASLFSIIVEDDVGAAAPLDCPCLATMKPEDFPKVIVVHGNFPSASSPSSSSSSSCLSPAAFLFSAGADKTKIFTTIMFLIAVFCCCCCCCCCSIQLPVQEHLVSSACVPLPPPFSNAMRVLVQRKTGRCFSPGG